MKIGYMPDTHGGPYNQPEPSREAAAQFCEQLLHEGIEAEKAGFDGLFLPGRSSCAISWTRSCWQGSPTSSSEPNAWQRMKTVRTG